MELDTSRYRYLVVWDIFPDISNATRRKLFNDLNKTLRRILEEGGSYVKLQRAVAAFTSREDAEKIAQLLQPPVGDSIILELKSKEAETIQLSSHIHKTEEVGIPIPETNRVIEFSKVSQYSGLLAECEPLANLIGEYIEISSVDYMKIPKYGEVAIITTRNKKRYYTFSRVVIEQLRNIEDTLKKGYIIKARITKKRRYITLE